MLNAGIYPGAILNHTNCAYEWKNNNGQLHNISGPALITPIGNGCNKVQFFVQGKELTRGTFKFFYPNAKV